MISRPFDERKIIFKKTIVVYGCLQCGIKRKSFTRLVYDLEISWRHILKEAEIWNRLKFQQNIQDFWKVHGRIIENWLQFL